MENQNAVFLVATMDTKGQEVLCLLLPYHINDTEFAEAVLETLEKLLK